MTDSMKFGPEWLRNMSAGDSTVSMTPARSYQLAEFRYGREEMLAMVDPNVLAPDPLRSIKSLYVEKTLSPLALIQMTEEETRMWNRGINSDAVLRLAGKGLGGTVSVPGVSGGVRGRGGPVERGRGGRGRGGYHYTRGLNYEDSEQPVAAARVSRPFDRQLSHGRTERGWGERNGVEGRGDGRSSGESWNIGNGGEGRVSGGDWSGGGKGEGGRLNGGEWSGNRPVENWNGRSSAEGGKLGGGHWNGGGRGEGSWRRSREGREEEAPGSTASTTPWRPSTSRQNSGGDKWVRERGSWRTSESDRVGRSGGWDDCGNSGPRRPWDPEDNLPEWAMENPSESGTFDATGAFHGGEPFSDEEEEPVSNGMVREANSSSHRGHQAVSSGGSREPYCSHIQNEEAAITSPQHEQTARRVQKTSPPNSSRSGDLPQSQNNSTTPPSKQEPPHHKLPSNSVECGTDREPVPSKAKSISVTRQQQYHPEPTTVPVPTAPALVSVTSRSEHTPPTNCAQQPKSKTEDAMARMAEVADDLVAKLVVDEEPAATPPPPPHSNTQDKWFYRDPQGQVQGPFLSSEMAEWFRSGYFDLNLLVCRTCDEMYTPLGKLIKIWGHIPFVDQKDVPPIKATGVPLDPATVVAPMSIPQVAGAPMDETLAQYQMHQYKQLFLRQQPSIAALAQDERLTTLEKQQFVMQQISTMEAANAALSVLRSPLPTPRPLNPPIPPSLTAEQNAFMAFMQQIHHQQNSFTDAGQHQQSDALQQLVKSWGGLEGQQISHKHHVLGGAVSEPASSQQKPLQELVRQMGGLQTTNDHPPVAAKLASPDHAPIQSLLRQLNVMDQTKADSVWGGVSSPYIGPGGTAPQWTSADIHKNIKTEQQIIEEQMRAEEARKREELRKQEEAKILQEEAAERARKQREEELKRLKQEEEDERRKKKEEELKKKLEAARKAELERQCKEEEKKRREEDKRKKEEEKKRRDEEKERKRKAEEEKQRELEEEERRREEELCEAEQRAEMQRRQAEALKRIEQQQQQARQQSQPVKAAPWTQSPAQSTTIADIQKTERLQQQAMREQQAAMAAVAAAQQQAAMKEAERVSNMQLKWAEAKTAPTRVKSFAEIQAEEQEQLARQLEREKAERLAASGGKEPAPVVGASTIWSGQNLTWASQSTNSVWGTSNLPPASSGFWEEVVPPVAKGPAKGLMKSSSASGLLSGTTGKPAGKTKAKKEELSVMKLFEQTTVVKDEFTVWCKKALTSIRAPIDVDTFICFLRDIESPYEVREYVTTYLGEGKEATDFAKQFIERRSQPKNSITSAPALSNNFKSKSYSVQDQTSSHEFHEVKGKSKKTKKNKMFRVDNKNLGFSVTASQDRINVGDRDYGEGI